MHTTDDGLDKGVRESKMASQTLRPSPQSLALTLALSGAALVVCASLCQVSAEPADTLNRKVEPNDLNKVRRASNKILFASLVPLKHFFH